ncbi:hypothetical protein [Aeromicrobium sp. UC242_57]|uniref:hypothetical protein n=1 Tax=Aeromicrobium sp. UC242_57 TaxID=3374624 RepID=UPI0037978301
MPLWVLVGLVVTLPPPAAADAASQRHRSALPGAAAGAVTAAVIIVPLVFGTLLWNATGASLTSRPTWKVNQEALADVRAAQDVDVPPGLWLLPPPHMEVLAISTVGPFAVVPRHYYLPGLVASDQERADRTVLFNLVSGLEPVEVREVADALDRLRRVVGVRLRRCRGGTSRPAASHGQSCGQWLT